MTTTAIAPTFTAASMKRIARASYVGSATE